MLVYRYSYGDTVILGSRITIELISRLPKTIYRVRFEQEGIIEHDSFKDITSDFKIISKEIDDTFNNDDEEGMNLRVITMDVEVYLNPKPEEIFTII